YTVTAPLEGVVSWLDVCVGTVSRPGTTVWGEILDLRELDVRCEVTPEQADRLAGGRPAEGGRPGDTGEGDSPGGIRYARVAADARGRILDVGIAADPRTGLVPVVVRLENAGGKLRSGVPVRVRFGEVAAASGR